MTRRSRLMQDDRTDSEFERQFFTDLQVMRMFPGMHPRRRARLWLAAYLLVGVVTVAVLLSRYAG